jgi:predicted ATPase
VTRACRCPEPHPRRRIVLTGGPGAGKTAVLEMVRQTACRHVSVLPEAAAMLFNDGFPRQSIAGVQQAAQRAIYHVQLEIENAYDAMGPGVLLCDRGVVDGSAYWPGPEDYWAAVGTTPQQAFARYDAVIHLRVPGATNGYGTTALRVETVQQARAIDERILNAWQGHPRRYIVEPTSDFLTKATSALEYLERELPDCCRVVRAGPASSTR